MLLNNQWIKVEITREIRKYLEMNENDNTTCRNLWNAARVVIKGNFTAVNANL